MNTLTWPAMANAGPEIRMLAYLAWVDLPVCGRGHRTKRMPMCADDMRMCRAEARRIGFEANGYVTDKGRAWAADMLTPMLRLIGMRRDGRIMPSVAAGPRS